MRPAAAGALAAVALTMVLAGCATGSSTAAGAGAGPTTTGPTANASPATSGPTTPPPGSSPVVTSPLPAGSTATAGPPSPTSSSGSTAAPSSPPASLGPPPVVDVCTTYFNKPMPRLEVTASAPTDPKRRAIIADLQRNLKRQGFDAGPTDGWYGVRTRDAVIAFQRDNALTPDGVMGPATWSTWFIVACGFD